MFGGHFVTGFDVLAQLTSSHSPGATPSMERGGHGSASSHFSSLSGTTSVSTQSGCPGAQAADTAPLPGSPGERVCDASIDVLGASLPPVIACTVTKAPSAATRTLS